ncbi:MAG: Gfo/Idh/MocA family oxidoreductase [Planctomycetota bacterium]|jgi:predicted dehydrogenase
MSDPLNVGVVGVGRLGGIHARIYAELEDVNLVAVVDADPARAQEVAAAYDVAGTSDYTALFGKVDAVSVATPTSSHAEIGTAFLERGIPVLIEKPMARDVGEADRLVAAAKKGNALLQVGHVERFNPAVMAAEKVIGVPLFIEAHRLSPFAFRSADIDVVLDLMIHDIDIIHHLVKSPLERVDAAGVAIVSPAVDIANARFVFRNGCVANVTASRVSAKRLRKIRIFSKEGYLSLDYGELRALLIQPTEAVRDGRINPMEIPEEAKGDPLPYFLTHLVQVQEIPFGEHEPLKRELEAFVHCVREGEVPQVSGEEGRTAMEIAEEVKASMRAHLERVRREGMILGDAP